MVKKTLKKILKHHSTNFPTKTPQKPAKAYTNKNKATNPNRKTTTKKSTIQKPTKHQILRLNVYWLNPPNPLGTSLMEVQKIV